VRPAADSFGARKVRAMQADPEGKPPTDMAAERSVIADLLDPDAGRVALDIIRDIIASFDFSDGRLGAIYEAICGVADQQRQPGPIGHVEIGAWLRAKDLSAGTRSNGAHLTPEERTAIVDAVSLQTTVEALSSAVTTQSRVEVRALRVRRLADHRRLIAKLFSAATSGYATDPDLFQAVAMELATDINETLGLQKSENKHIGAALESAVKRMLTREGPPPEFVTTGIQELDDAMHLGPGRLVVIGARSGVGKSVLSMQIAAHVGLHFGPVLYFSTEMSADELAIRVACSFAEVDSRRAERRQLSEKEYIALQLIVDDVKECMTHINDDTSTMVLADIVGNARRHARLCAARGQRLRVVIVDYLQKVEPSASPTGRNREQDVAHIAKALKGLAMELQCCVVVPCQLNKEAEKRKDPRPRASDARESSGIENEADVFLLIHNPAYNERETRPANVSPLPPEACEIVIGKNRSGPKGVARVMFHPSYTKFVQMTQAEIDDQRGPL
jgi:replicative DNA helicase